jgi:hypothetical protein
MKEEIGALFHLIWGLVFMIWGFKLDNIVLKVIGGFGILSFLTVWL